LSGSWSTTSDCTGSGTNSGVIAGVNWVANNAIKPAVANMSLGGGGTPTAETTTTTAFDTLKVQVLDTAGTVLQTLATYSNLNASASYAQKSFDLSSRRGQTVRIRFLGVEDASLQTSFLEAVRSCSHGKASPSISIRFRP
jgi:hypothetical protein